MTMKQSLPRNWRIELPMARKIFGLGGKPDRKLLGAFPRLLSFVPIHSHQLQKGPHEYDRMTGHGDRHTDVAI